MSRLPIIRHIRWAIAAAGLERHLSWCRRMGLGIVANDGDLKHLRDIWEGRR
jgi:hypothetical protein